MQRAAVGYEIAQLNVARLTAPLSSPQLQSFVDRLDEINALAEASPGFRVASKAREATPPTSGSATIRYCSST
jgi:hypothetical protein